MRQPVRALEDWKRLAAAAAMLLGLAGCVEDIEPRPVAGGECPPWGSYPPLFYGNEPSPYIGCLQNVNLLQEVDRTADTVSGRPLGPADGTREILSITNYETGKVTPLLGGTGSTTTSSGGGS